MQFRRGHQADQLTIYLDSKDRFRPQRLKAVHLGRECAFAIGEMILNVFCPESDPYGGMIAYVFSDILRHDKMGMMSEEIEKNAVAVVDDFSLYDIDFRFAKGLPICSILP
jgi:hypothetical protein